MTNFLVAFVGLPSSGKSSIINSLLFKRKLQSGVCRTTTDANTIDELIVDDYNNVFNVIDLPGICDSEENNDQNFNEMTYAHVTNAKLILWVSDVNKAFITTHEVNEYNKLKNHINKLSDDTGTLYYIAIMLSKCDKDCKKRNKKVKNKKIQSDELEDSDEDTDINDLVDKVKSKFPNDDIILFNAYGRSYHHKKSSDVLKKFVNKMAGMPTNQNINFDISKYIIYYMSKQEKMFYDKFIAIYDAYICNTATFEKMIESWDKITLDEKVIFFISILNNNKQNNWKIFRFVIYLSESYHFELTDEDHLLCDNWQIKYYNHMIIDNSFLRPSHNLTNEFTTTEVYELIQSCFERFNDELKLKYYQELVTTSNIPIADAINIIILLNESYDIEHRQKLFNNIIINCAQSFDRFYKIMMNINKENYDFLEINDNPIVTYINYLEHIKKLFNNEEYILLNKIQICNCLIFNLIPDCHFRKLTRLDHITKSISYNRLTNNDDYNNHVSNIWCQIYSNILIGYNHSN